MVEALTLSDLCAIEKWARDQPSVLRVWLYGSRARGNHRVNRDLDLAIEAIGDDEVASQIAFSDLTPSFKAMEGFRLSSSPDVHWYHPEADLDYVGSGVRRDGVLLFERGPSGGIVTI